MPVFLLAGSYLLGAVPFGYLFGRLKGIDLRSHGSGNIGTTNAFRVLGRKMGILVFFCDLIKGLIPALLGKTLLGPGWGVAAGLAAVIGHNWSVFLGFKGGRGVATGAGVVLALMPEVILLAFGIWVAVVLLTGYVSLGSIVASLSVPLVALFFREPWIYFLFAIPAPLFIVFKHLPNIRRLQKGTEPRIRFW
ncbi:MAG: glycerol-3-phosphate 1-O-acyltransferase PlsY [Firmicutes bacterium]|nr:glycerol-3-phosphate 1-O-acyltransferase PlsY [Bacillota bacterium]